MSDEIKRSVQQQFGAHADQYVVSSVHAKGYSLNRLVELTQPQLNWSVLDIATGGGHTALAFAPHVKLSLVTDLTFKMVQAARGHLEENGSGVFDYAQADGEHLPFADGAFNCVTCRIAPHHFPDVEAFVKESARVLAPGGFLAVADNVVSGEPKIGDYINAFEKLRDPSHNRAYTIDDWQTFFFAAGLEVTHSELFGKEMAFDNWATRLGLSGDDLTRLRVMLVQAPEGVKDWLKPQQVGDALSFTITEAIIIGRKG